MTVSIRCPHLSVCCNKNRGVPHTNFIITRAPQLERASILGLYTCVCRAIVSDHGVRGSEWDPTARHLLESVSGSGSSNPIMAIPNTPSSSSSSTRGAGKEMGGCRGWPSPGSASSQSYLIPLLFILLRSISSSSVSEPELLSSQFFFLWNIQHSVSAEGVVVSQVTRKGETRLKATQRINAWGWSGGYCWTSVYYSLRYRSSPATT